nr:MAG TPA: minor tail protein [Caudoviricetes sp.]
MAEPIRIDVSLTATDNTEAGVRSATTRINTLERSANSASNSIRNTTSNVDRSVQQSQERISRYDETVQRTRKSLLAWAKEKYQVLLEAKEKVTPILNTVKSGLKSFAGKTWNVTLKAIDLITTPLKGVLNLLKNPILQAGVVLGVSLSLTDTVNTYKDFQAAMSNVKAISGASGSEFDMLTSKAEEMGSTTKFTATEAAEAFNYMAMAGWNAQQMTDGIEGILNLASASGEDLATTSDIVTDALTAFGLKASDAGHFSDVLAQASSSANTDVGMMGETFKYVASMAGSLGYSIEDVALMTGLMANSGIKSTQAGTALNAVLTRLATNTNGAADSIQELGVNFYDSAGNARPLATVIGELREATQGMNQEQKTSLANTVAGMEAQKGLMAILNASEEDYNKLADSINNADGAAKKMSDIQLDNLSGDITLFQSAVDGLKISLGGRLTNTWLRDIVQGLTKQVPNAQNVLDEAMDIIEKNVDRMKRKFKEVSKTDEWQNANIFGKVTIAWDEFIIEPFSEWWESNGKAKINSIAKDIGNGIGSGLKFGITALLGIDISETLDEGSTLGASFAQGFSQGFDFDLISQKIWDGLGNIVSNASKLLPGGESADLSSIFSAALLMKIGSPLLSMGQGAFSLGKTLFGAGSTGTSIASTILGSASAGTGILGKSSMLAIKLGAGNLASGASLSAGGLSALGMGAGAGAIAGGATLVSSAMDLYKSIKSDNKDEKSAYGGSAAWKAGGVVTGAVAGASLGSVIPGLGTVVGGLIGAGIGGITGWIKGNKIKEEYQENVEEMQKLSEKTQKVFDITGLSIEKVKFANNDLNEAMKDSSLSVDELATYIREDIQNVGKNAFGDIKLSLTEVKDLAKEITFSKAVDSVNDFKKAVSKADTYLSSLKNSQDDLKKANWKIGLGLDLTSDDLASYRKTVDTYVNNAKEYIESKRWEATTAFNLILGNGDTSGIDNVYSDITNQIEELSNRLSATMDIALSDGVITLDEQAEITNLQQQIEDVVNKVSEAEQAADLDILKIKYASAQIDFNSFTSLQDELQAQVSELTENYDDALKITLKNIHLQFPDGGEEMEQAIQQAYDGYNAQIQEMNLRVQSFNLNTIADAWSDQLNGILPEMQGTLEEKLSKVLEVAKFEKPDVTTWTQQDMMSWLGLDNMEIDTSAFENIFAELSATASMMSTDKKGEITQNIAAVIPTMEEVMQVRGPISDEAYSSMVEEYKTALEGAVKDAGFNNIISDNISTAVANTDMGKIITELKSIGDKSGLEAVNAFNSADYSGVSSSVGNGIGSAINNTDMQPIISAINLVKSNTDDKINSSFSAGITTRMPVNVMLDYNVINPTKTFSLTGDGATGSASVEVSAHANGGFVGNKQLSWVGEEGPEAIIPLVPGRRNRALTLFKQVGEILGIDKNANGGIIQSNQLSANYTSSDSNVLYGLNKTLSDTDYKIYNTALKNAPISYNNSTDDNETSDNNTTVQKPLSVTTSEQTGNNTVQVNVQVSPEFVINNSSGQSEADILTIIKNNIKGMADELGGEIAERLEAVFSNMPIVRE